ncbi:hypothetical protein CCR75_005440 [Bremia lactucae]|uniref:Uncharacterized protein n=1 Tax=Bremia lactucae TaxID=4779 RepID=A0A976FG03_BRELC|nr:hypothetical protein CCR75_005440 [Bremia lactucae]
MMRVQEFGRDECNTTALARLKRIINGCAFVAIDTEMGGISCQDTPRASVMDKIDERYAQYRQSAHEFPLVQFGLSIFTWDANARVFRVETYQFPLFPVFHDKGQDHSSASISGMDRRFLIQAKCLQYIRAHGFDLNVWIDRGIGHLSHFEQQQEPCKSALEQSAKPAILPKFDSTQPILKTKETQTFLNDIQMTLKQKLRAFKDSNKDGTVNKARYGQEFEKKRRNNKNSKKKNLKNESTRRLIDDKGEESQRIIQEQPKMHINGSDEDGLLELDTRTIDDLKQFLQTPVSNAQINDTICAYVTEPLAPFRRITLMQYLYKMFPDAVALDCQVDNIDDKDVIRNPWKRRIRIIFASSKHQRLALLQANQELEDDAIRERNLKLIGFTAVFDVIVGAKKPIIGHNMLLDLMQCYDKFHEPLPRQCAEFQFQLHAWLGVGGGVFDTKTLVDYAMKKVDAFATHLTHSTLENCYEVLSKHPFYGPEIQATPLSLEDNVSSPSQIPLQAHQAGYDAFMTGYVFLRVCSGLGVSNECIASLEKGSDGAEIISNAALETLRNALFVSHFVPTFVLHLPGPYPLPTRTPSRSRFLLMKLTRTRAAPALNAQSMSRNTSCPALKTFHIKHCVGWALNLQSATRLVHVHWTNHERVFIELPSVEAVEQLLAVRAQTKDCWGTTNDPMPSIGCVDLDRCPASSTHCTEKEEMNLLGHEGVNLDDKPPRKRKSSEMAQ